MEQKDFHGMRLLAQSIRRRIMDVVHKNGGHLASNLGIVELMVALHKTFHFPDDKLLFDVSHQCYAHKLLSGRDGDAFDLLRKDGGLCGFCNPSESPWDIFHVGHAGTALSSALGLAASRDRRKGNEHIIALLGDGSLTCGLTWEAMQWVRQTTERLIIIINDNGFSIDPTGGAIGAHLEKLRHGKVAAKNSLFQHMGMDYHGPIDGHCLENLVDSLEYARTKACPQVIHVVTKKGYGDRDAEMFPADFHGICGKERQKEEIFSDSLSYYGELCGRALCQLAEMDERIVAITAAMRIGTGLSPFAEKFPERFFDVGIGESHAVTFAAAMARDGLRPIICLYSSFAQRSVGQFFHDVCLQKLPVVLCLDRAGLSCSDGDTHHGLYDIAQFSHFPSITFAQPASLKEFHQMLSMARHTTAPFLLRYGKEKSSKPYKLSDPPPPIAIGHGEILQSGGEVSIWALGEFRLQQAWEVAKMCHEINIDVEVVNARFICPLDLQQLRKSSQSKLLVTLEDHGAGGFGCAIKEALIAMGHTPRVLSFFWHPPIGFAESEEILRRRHRQTAGDIFHAIGAHLCRQQA